MAEATRAPSAVAPPSVFRARRASGVLTAHGAASYPAHLFCSQEPGNHTGPPGSPRLISLSKYRLISNCKSWPRGVTLPQVLGIRPWPLWGPHPVYQGLGRRAREWLPFLLTLTCNAQQGLCLGNSWVGDLLPGKGSHQFHLQAGDLWPGFSSSLQIRPDLVNTQHAASRPPCSTQITKPSGALGSWTSCDIPGEEEARAWQAGEIPGCIVTSSHRGTLQLS